MSRPGTAARLQLSQSAADMPTADHEGILQQRCRPSPSLLSHSPTSSGRTTRVGSRAGSRASSKRPTDPAILSPAEDMPYRSSSGRESIKSMTAPSAVKLHLPLRPASNRKPSLPSVGARSPTPTSHRSSWANAFQLPKLEQDNIVNTVFFNASGPSYMTFPKNRGKSLSSLLTKGQEGVPERQQRPRKSGVAWGSPAGMMRATSDPCVARDGLKHDAQGKLAPGSNALQEPHKDSDRQSIASTEAPMACAVDREPSVDSDDDLLVPTGYNTPGVEPAPEKGEPCMDWYTWDFLDNDDELRMRSTFRRFADMGVSEVPQERLYELIAQMGFMNATPQLVQEVAKETSQFTMMDFLDFREVVERFAKHERQIVREKVAAWVESTKACSFKSLLSFLRTLGRVVTKEAVAEAVAEIGLELDGPVRNETILRLLGLLRLREGFTQEQMNRLVEIFEDLSSLNPNANKFSPRLPGSTPPRSAGLIKACDISRGLFDYGGAYLFEAGLKLLEKVAVHEAAPSAPFCEFLAWARALRDSSMQELWDCFTKVDVNRAGSVERNVLHILALKLGFTLSGEAITEMLANIGLAEQEALSFDDVVLLMNECRRCHGFAKEEAARLNDIYQKFDYNGDGDLDHIECLDMIRYIGCTTRIDVVQAFMKKYDFDQDGKMGMTEFLRLMRFQREQEMQEVRGAYQRSSRGHRMLTTRNLPKALTLLGQQAVSEVLREVLTAEGNPQVLPFEVFARIVDRCREVVTKERRRHAGFDSGVFQQLTEVFNSKAEPPQEEGGLSMITLGQLLRMLAECDIPVNTTDGRQALLKGIEDARRAAVEAGLQKSEVGEPGSPGVPYWTFIHLVRGLVRERQVVVMNRETETLQSTRFSTIEAEQFRKIFSGMVQAQDADKEEAAGRKSRKRWSALQQHMRTTGSQDIALAMSRSSCRKTTVNSAFLREKPSKKMSLKELLDSITAVPTLPQSAITSVLQSIGLRVSLPQLDELRGTMRSLAADRNLDLSCFLQLMRWMLDTNYANINGTTKRAVERLKQQTAPGSEGK